MPESVNAKAIEATIKVLDDRLLETGFVTSASSSIRVILNWSKLHLGRTSSVIASEAKQSRGT